MSGGSRGGGADHRARTREFELKYQDEQTQKKEAYERISVLENELAQQEKYFEKEIGE